MIKIGLAGTWHVHFEGYTKDIIKREECCVTALWDTDAERGKKYAEQFNCEFVADYAEFLTRVDAVSVCTSTDIHPQVITAAALAGKHIFTEKVLCTKSEDAYAIRDAVKKSGVKFCISFPWRSRNDFIWIKNAVDSGLVGDVTYCRMRNAHNGASAGWLPKSFYDKQACGGGAMMDLGAHPMYLLNWYMGKPVKVSSAFTHFMVDSVEDNAVSVLTYANGAIGVSETAFVAQNDPFSLEIVGTKGTILSGGLADKTAYNTGDGWKEPENLPDSLPSPVNMWVDAMAYGKEIEFTIDDAVALTETMEAAYNNIF